MSARISGIRLHWVESIEDEQQYALVGVTADIEREARYTGITENFSYALDEDLRDRLNELHDDIVARATAALRGMK